MRSRRTLQVCLAAIAALVALAQFLPGTSSSFTASTSNSGSTATAVADWTGPTVGATAIQKSEGGLAGSIRQGATFYLYATVTDSGNPASGVASVSASVANVATVSSATMTSGSYTVGGTSYGYRSALLTAKASLASGSYSYSVSGTDSGGNAGSATSGTVTVDNTAFSGADYVWTDAGTAGRYEPGETVKFVYNKTVEPNSIVSGWNGGSTSVPVTMVDSAVYGTASDILFVTNTAGTAQIPVGTAYLSSDYVASTKTLKFTGSTMTASGSTVTVTLGTWDVSANSKTVAAPLLPTWTPMAAATDAAGNASATTTSTSFGATSLTAANKTGGTAGKTEAGDTLSYVFNKAPTASSILSGWSGASTAVTVRVTDKATAGTASDTVAVLDGSGNAVNLGSVLTGGDYVTAGTLDFTGSTMVLSGSTVTITLGTASAATTHTDGSGHKPAWTPDAGVTDAFGANGAAFSVTPGSNVVEF